MITHNEEKLTKCAESGNSFGRPFVLKKAHTHPQYTRARNAIINLHKQAPREITCQRTMCKNSKMQIMQLFCKLTTIYYSRSAQPQCIALETSNINCISSRGTPYRPYHTKDLIKILFARWIYNEFPYNNYWKNITPPQNMSSNKLPKHVQDLFL